VKRLLLLIYISITIQLLAFSQTLKILPNTFYTSGEILKFNLRYGFIIAGEVKLELKESISENNNLLHIVGTAQTKGIADKIFLVHDIYESYIDIESGLPVYSIQNVSEGRKYKYYNDVRFNRQNGTLNSKKSGEHKVTDKNILDIVSAFYYIRRVDLSKAKENEIYKLLTFFSDSEFPLELRYRGIEVIDTKWGKINCLKFAPIVEPGRVFKSKDDMYIWYTNDENRIPIQITMEMLVGHITVELTDYAGLKKPPVFKN
jgi:hypothetical protein